MSNHSGRSEGPTYRQTAARPMSKPPACKEGEVIRSLERGHGERVEDAIVRAEALGWWRRRTRRVPYATARCWVWLVRVHDQGAAR